MAAGPSFSLEQARILKSAHEHTIVVNTSYQRLPDADVLYAGDRAWWDVHFQQVRETFRGELWTQDRRTAHLLGLYHVEHSNEPGLSFVRGRVHSGGNSGYVAIGLAYMFGAREILLVGYDFKDAAGMSHWHGDHPPQLSQQRPYEGWLISMRSLAAALKDVGVSVINCSTDSAIDCFPFGDLAQCLSS